MMHPDTLNRHTQEKHPSKTPVANIPDLKCESNTANHLTTSTATIKLTTAKTTRKPTGKKSKRNVEYSSYYWDDDEFDGGKDDVFPRREINGQFRSAPLHDEYDEEGDI